MEEIREILDSIIELNRKKREAEKEFAEELNRLIEEHFDGDFTKFMNDVLFTTDYISIRFDVERMLGKPLF